MLKPFGSLILAVAAAWLLVSCKDAPREQGSYLERIGAASIRREAAIFYKDLFLSPETTYFHLNPEKCPPTFRTLDPKQVRGYPDGFALTLSSERGTEEGLYVVPEGMELSPRENRSSKFRKIAEGIYWYSFSD